MLGGPANHFVTPDLRLSWAVTIQDTGVQFCAIFFQVITYVSTMKVNITGVGGVVPELECDLTIPHISNWCNQRLKLRNET